MRKNKFGYWIVNYRMENKEGKLLDVRLWLTEKELKEGVGHMIVEEKYPDHTIAFVSRSSGLLDKNGTEIFQGQSVKTEERGYESIIIHEGRFVVGRMDMGVIEPDYVPLKEWHNRCVVNESNYIIVDLTGEQ